MAWIFDRRKVNYGIKDIKTMTSRANTIFSVIIHYNNFLNNRCISLNSTREYNFLATDDLAARHYAIKNFEKEWELWDRDQLIEKRVIEILYCETKIVCYLDNEVEYHENVSL